MSDVPEVHVQAPVHAIVARLRNFLLVLGTLITAVSVGSTWIITQATGEVRDEIQYLQQRAVVDSVRFERSLDVIELVALALVEPEGSVSREAAIAQLRSRRHITTR